MVRVLVSEKGGQERELTFEEGEITIGRLQGNAISLPKPNVSKRHATLSFRDGRLLVIDLKSTNGTYVNGRRIAAPKEVGPADRIYIGDFTLQVIPEGASAMPPAFPSSPEGFPVSPSSDEQQQDLRRPTVAMTPMGPEAAELPALDLEVEILPEDAAEPMPPPLPGATAFAAPAFEAPPPPDSVSGPISAPVPAPEAPVTGTPVQEAVAPAPPAPAVEAPPQVYEEVEAFPLDVETAEPASASAPEPAPVPAPGPAPVPAPEPVVKPAPVQAPAPEPTPASRPVPEPIPMPSGPIESPAAPVVEPLSRPSTPVPRPQSEPAPAQPMVVAEAAPRPEGSGLSSVGRRPSVPSGEEMAALFRHLEIMRVLADRVADSVFADVDPGRSDFPDDEWQRLSQAVMRIVEAARREGAIPADADPVALTQDVLFEFAGLGALEEILGDQSIRQIMVDGLDRIFVTRRSGTERILKGFASEQTLGRIIAKLMELSGMTAAPGATHIQGLLPDGTFLQILRPPLVVGGTVLVFDRPAGSLLQPEDLVAVGMLTEEQLAFLGKSIRQHSRVVVYGPSRSDLTVFLNALIRLVPEHERVVVVERRHELSLSHPDHVCLCKDALECVHGPGGCAVARLLPDVTVVSDVEVEDLALLRNLCLSGRRGLITTVAAESAASGALNLALMVAFAFPGVGEAASRALVARLSDVVVELETGHGGRPRARIVQGMGLSSPGLATPKG